MQEKYDTPEPLSAQALREKALSLLARREYARKELATRLRQYSTADIVDEVVETLQQEGLQDDRRFVDAKIRVQEKKFGALRIRNDLKKAGVDSQMISENLGDKDDIHAESTRALAILQKKYRHAKAIVGDAENAHETRAKAKAQKIRFLQSRGFSWAVVKLALSQFSGEAVDTDAPTD